MSVFWSHKQVPWSKTSTIENFVQTLNEKTLDLDLKGSLIEHYKKKHLKPTFNKKNAMRRLECTIQCLNFEEIQYTLGDNYINKREPSKGI